MLAKCTRLGRQALKSYDAALTSNPIRTKMITSVSLAGFGDACVQRMQLGSTVPHEGHGADTNAAYAWDPARAARQMVWYVGGARVHCPDSCCSLFLYQFANCCRSGCTVQYSCLEPKLTPAPPPCIVGLALSLRSSISGLERWRGYQRYPLSPLRLLRSPSTRLCL